MRLIASGFGISTIILLVYILVDMFSGDLSFTRNDLFILMVIFGVLAGVFNNVAERVENKDG
jgi:hypothetical protein